MTSFRVGAQLFSVRNLTQDEASLDSTLTAIAAMGYKCAQLSGHSRQIPAEAIKAMLEKTGLDAPSTHQSLEQIETGYEAMVKAHHLWGTKYPGIGSMPAANREGGKQGFIAFAKAAGEAAKRLKQDGLTLVYHNHAFEFAKFDGVTGMQILMDYAPQELQFELDTYWAQAGGVDPVEWIGKLKGRIDVIHFKEMTGGEHGPEMAPFGEGNLNWKAIFAASEGAGVKWAFIEQDNAAEGPDPLGCMKTSLVNLEKAGATL